MAAKIRTYGIICNLLNKGHTVDNDYLKKFVLPKPYLEKPEALNNYHNKSKAKIIEENKMINKLPSKYNNDISASLKIPSLRCTDRK